MLAPSLKVEYMRIVVIGATGIVGGYIVERLLKSGVSPCALSRSPPCDDRPIDWVVGDLAYPEALQLPPASTIFCTVHVGLLADALPLLQNPSLKRVVAFTSTSLLTKANSDVPAEREGIAGWRDAEQRLIDTCERLGIAWTILRPTIIYAEGRDQNITRLAGLIRKFGFLPLAGAGEGLRQPVHAEDLAIGALAAAQAEASANKVYALPGGEVLTYREMVGRIFDGLKRPRRTIAAPPLLWQMAFAVLKPFFPKANAAMGNRMAKDMVFDASAAITDFGWSPRPFHPRFD